VIAASRRRTAATRILGNNVKGDVPSSANMFSGRTAVSSFTLASAGTLTELHAWVWNGAGDCRIVVYADSAGSPGTRVAYTNALSFGTGDVEIVQTGLAVALAAGTYWLGYNGNGTGSMYADGATGTHKQRDGATYNPPPDPFGTVGSSGTRKFSVWGIVT